MITENEIYRIPKDLRSEIHAVFHKYEMLLVAYLRDIVSNSYPDNISVIQFEVFMDNMAGEFPIRKFMLDEFKNECFVVSHDDTKIFESDFFIPENIIHDAHLVYVIDDFEYLVSLMLIYWFSRCCDESDCIDFDKDMFIRMHDSSWNFDLRHKEWVRTI